MPSGVTEEGTPTASTSGLVNQLAKIAYIYSTRRLRKMLYLVTPPEQFLPVVSCITRKKVLILSSSTGSWLTVYDESMRTSNLAAH